jgi:hypothetical protein
MFGIQVFIDVADVVEVLSRIMMATTTNMEIFDKPKLAETINYKFGYVLVIA